MCGDDEVLGEVFYSNLTFESSSCACAFINDVLYTKENKKYKQYEKSLLARSCLQNAEVPQNKIYTKNRLVDLAGVVLVAA